MIGPRFACQGSGSIQSGRFAGKMIVVQTPHGRGRLPVAGRLVPRAGRTPASAGRIDDRYRLWFVDHAMHTGAEPMPGMVLADTTPSRTTRMVSYLGVLQQALRDVAAWVEHGVPPPASTDDRGGRRPGARAAHRRGAQGHPAGGRPDRRRLRRRRRRGGRRGAVRRASSRCRPAPGQIVSAEWDFEGTAEYPLEEEGLDGSADRLRASATHTFAAPGTYFPAVRVTTQRQGDVDTPHARIENLGRVRVIVGDRARRNRLRRIEGER